MQSTNKNLIALSGAPGAGKTTLLNVLQSRGYACVPEVARRIIQEQMQSGGNALPWQDTTTYINLMLQNSIASFLQHQHAQHPTFFDRGLPDTLRYENHVILAEGDYVIAHGRFSGHGRPRSWIAADIVRFEDGKLAEHWDVLQDEATQAESVSGLPMFGDRFPGEG